VEYILIGICVVITAFFVMAEMALVSSNRRRLSKLAESGDVGAQKALNLINDPNKFLSTVQIGMTFLGIIAAIYGGHPLAQKLAPHLSEISWKWGSEHSQVLAEGIVSFIIGALTVVFAEIVPKRLALIKPESMASAMSRPMAWELTIASPLVALLSGCADLVLLIFGRRRTPEDTISEDELRMMVDQGMATGVLHALEHRMVHGALSLDLTTAEQLMTPSSRVVWLNLNDPEEINWRKVVASGHTWFPVFRDSADRPLGVVSVKRLWANLSLTGTARDQRFADRGPNRKFKYYWYAIAGSFSKR
jgi:putative hemolysin